MHYATALVALATVAVEVALFNAALRLAHRGHRLLALAAGNTALRLHERRTRRAARRP